MIVVLWTMCFAAMLVLARFWVSRKWSHTAAQQLVVQPSLAHEGGIHGENDAASPPLAALSQPLSFVAKQSSKAQATTLRPSPPSSTVFRALLIPTNGHAVTCGAAVGRRVSNENNATVHTLVALKPEAAPWATGTSHALSPSTRSTAPADLAIQHSSLAAFLVEVDPVDPEVVLVSDRDELHHRRTVKQQDIVISPAQQDVLVRQEKSFVAQQRLDEQPSSSQQTNTSGRRQTYYRVGLLLQAKVDAQTTPLLQRHREHSSRSAAHPVAPRSAVHNSMDASPPSGRRPSSSALRAWSPSVVVMFTSRDDRIAFAHSLRDYVWSREDPSGVQSGIPAPRLELPLRTPQQPDHDAPSKPPPPPHEDEVPIAVHPHASPPAAPSHDRAAAPPSPSPAAGDRALPPCWSHPAVVHTSAERFVAGCLKSADTRSAFWREMLLDKFDHMPLIVGIDGVVPIQPVLTSVYCEEGAWQEEEGPVACLSSVTVHQQVERNGESPARGVEAPSSRAQLRAARCSGSSPAPIVQVLKASFRHPGPVRINFSCCGVDPVAAAGAASPHHNHQRIPEPFDVVVTMNDFAANDLVVAVVGHIFSNHQQASAHADDNARPQHTSGVHEPAHLVTSGVLLHSLTPATCSTSIQICVAPTSSLRSAHLSEQALRNAEVAALVAQHTQIFQSYFSEKVQRRVCERLHQTPRGTYVSLRSDGPLLQPREDHVVASYAPRRSPRDAGLQHCIAPAPGDAGGLQTQLHAAAADALDMDRWLSVAELRLESYNELKRELLFLSQQRQEEDAVFRKRVQGEVSSLQKKSDLLQQMSHDLHRQRAELRRNKEDWHRQKFDDEADARLERVVGDAPSLSSASIMTSGRSWDARGAALDAVPNDDEEAAVSSVSSSAPGDSNEGTAAAVNGPSTSPGNIREPGELSVTILPPQDVFTRCESSLQRHHSPPPQAVEIEVEGTTERIATDVPQQQQPNGERHSRLTPPSVEDTSKANAVHDSSIPPCANVEEPPALLHHAEPAVDDDCSRSPPSNDGHEEHPDNAMVVVVAAAVVCDDAGRMVGSPHQAHEAPQKEMDRSTTFEASEHHVSTAHADPEVSGGEGEAAKDDCGVPRVESVQSNLENEPPAEPSRVSVDVRCANDVLSAGRDSGYIASWNSTETRALAELADALRLDVSIACRVPRTSVHVDGLRFVDFDGAVHIRAETSIAPQNNGRTGAENNPSQWMQQLESMRTFCHAQNALDAFVLTRGGPTHSVVGSYHNSFSTHRGDSPRLRAAAPLTPVTLDGSAGSMMIFTPRSVARGTGRNSPSSISVSPHLEKLRAAREEARAHLQQAAASGNGVVRSSTLEGAPSARRHPASSAVVPQLLGVVCEESSMRAQTAADNLRILSRMHRAFSEETLLLQQTAPCVDVGERRSRLSSSPHSTPRVNVMEEVFGMIVHDESKIRCVLEGAQVVERQAMLDTGRRRASYILAAEIQDHFSAEQRQRNVVAREAAAGWMAYCHEMKRALHQHQMPPLIAEVCDEEAVAASPVSQQINAHHVMKTFHYATFADGDLANFCTPSPTQRTTNVVTEMLRCGVDRDLTVVEPILDRCALSVGDVLLDLNNVALHSHEHLREVLAERALRVQRHLLQEEPDVHVWLSGHYSSLRVEEVTSTLFPMEVVVLRRSDVVLVRLCT